MSRRRLRVLLVGLALWLGPVGSAGCSGCRAVDLDGAWRSFRDGQVGEAEESFGRIVETCPTHREARTGLGYVGLRTGDLETAERMFDGVLEVDPRAVDALVGLGMLQWRRGDATTARQLFRRAVAVDPDNTTALGYLDRFPPDTDREDRPALVRPDTLVLPARVAGRHFEVRGPGGWEAFYVKGVNIGVGIPGRHPTEFPDSSTYAVWLRLIGTMGSNAIRTYTMHPPALYEALLDYNRAHGDAPIRLFQGVWAELPPDGTDFDHPEWREAFFAEMHRVVDMIHGRADVPVQPGHASGYYTADVSPWTAGYILGREWEAEAVSGYNELAGSVGAWAGRYVEVAEGTATDVWMAKAIDEIVSYETGKYNAQRPVAYTNWPPTDPLRHPTESDVEEESAVRRGFGSVGDSIVGLAGADAVTLDPLLMTASDAFDAGLFASYHVYPYYPDFMVLEPDLAAAVSPFGPSNFWGYLVRLRERHGDMPVLIAEYGIPASVGIAHFQPQGWHHGGVDEERMAAVVGRMTREIEAADMAGGIVFSWIDEWFKKTWITEPMEVPQERDRLWYNRMDPEEHYGMLAAEPEPALEGETLGQRLAEWRRDVPPLYETPDGSVLRATTDAAYVWILVEPGSGAASRVRVGFDVLDPAGGVFHWPGRPDERLPVGLEFALTVGAGEARLVADSAYRPVRIDSLDFTPPGEPDMRPAIVDPAPDFLRGRFLQTSARTLRPGRRGEGVWAPLRVLTNRLRFGRDSTEFAAMGYDWGVLPGGAPPDGLWEWEEGVLEARIPWQLLNFSDPSQHRVLAYDEVRAGSELGTTTTTGVRLVFAIESPSGDLSPQAAPEASAVAELTWPEWEMPRWRTRIRPAYFEIREAWKDMAPAGPRPGGGP